MYQKTTHNIRISVDTDFLEDQSDSHSGHYVWAYHVTIENLGEETVTLKSRYWHIRDANGAPHDVQGAGVVGETPTLNPGDDYHYSSGTPLETPSGMMHGHYVMENERGHIFEVAIPAFSLDSPYDKSLRN